MFETTNQNICLDCIFRGMSQCFFLVNHRVSKDCKNDIFDFSSHHGSYYIIGWWISIIYIYIYTGFCRGVYIRLLECNSWWGPMTLLWSSQGRSFLFGRWHWLYLGSGLYCHMSYVIIYYLVGGFNPSEKYQSVGIIIPNIWKKTCFKSTNQKYSPNRGKQF